MQNLLDGVEFRHPSSARTAALRLGTGLPERIVARIQVLLASVPDPDAVVRYLERLRLESPSAFDRVSSSTAALRCAVLLFSFSNFLSEAVLKNPERILQVANSGDLYRVLTADEYEERLFDFLGHDRNGAPAAEDLALFRRRQLPRIVVRDGWGIASLSDVTEELSNLADAILDVTYRRIREELAAIHGEPRLSDGASCGLSVIALGKLGGKELNYSSDIDLMFVYGGAGETDGPEPVTNKEFYKKVANRYTALLSSYTSDGQCYRVDLRLRPDGTLGEICTSLEGAKAYYEQRARDWEKQMRATRCWISSSPSFIKARSIFGPWRPCRLPASGSAKRWRPSAG
jgi:glutamate-ammonia-ligase adenylyltransferase